MKPSTRYVCLCLTMIVPILASAQTGTVMVPAEGALLATSYYLPGGAGPFPAMVARTPYGRATLAGEASKWVNDGYAFVAQDLRTTGGSPDPSVQLFEADGWGEKQDAVVTIDWVLAQGWCNGKVGTLGFSAPGAASMLAGGASTRLTTQIIENAPSSFFGEWAYQGNVSRRELSGSWDSLGRWRSHPAYDAFWSVLDGTARAPFVTAPGLIITGWFDIFQKGGIDAFMARQHGGGSGARGKQHLVITPEDHAGLSGALSFPGAALSPGRTATRRDFNNHWMRNTGTGLPYTVKYYVMGASGEAGAPGNEWRYAGDWPPYPTTARAYALQPDGTLSTAPPSAQHAALTFAFDPNSPVPTHGGPNLTILPAGPQDQRAIGARSDVLRFQTEPLNRPLEIAGNVTVRLYVSSSAVDTDFTAKLVDIYPDGREMLFCDGIQRVKFRNSREVADPLPPGAVGELSIDLWHTCLVFNVGHRIGLHVSSSNYPRFEVNPNNGQDFADNAKALSIIAENTVHMGTFEPSALLLPVNSRADYDEDGLDEEEEALNQTDPQNADTDGDGLTDGQEVNTYRTDPLSQDTDNDGYSDAYEVAHGSDPNDGSTRLPLCSGLGFMVLAAGLAIGGMRRARSA